MQDTGCLGLVHGDDPHKVQVGIGGLEGGDEGGARVQRGLEELEGVAKGVTLLRPVLRAGGCQVAHWMRRL